MSSLAKGGALLAVVVVGLASWIVVAHIASNRDHDRAVRDAQQDLTARSQQLVTDVVAALRRGPTTYEQIQALGAAREPVLHVGAVHIPGQLVLTTSAVEGLSGGGNDATRVFVCTQTTIPLPELNQSVTPTVIPCPFQIPATPSGLVPPS